MWFLILRPTFRTAETLILFSYNSRQSESNWRHIEDSSNRTMRLNANDSDGKVDKIRCHSYWRQNCKYGLEFKGFCILVIYHTINTKRGEDNYKPYFSISACVTIKYTMHLTTNASIKWRHRLTIIVYIAINITSIIIQPIYIFLRIFFLFFKYSVVFMLLRKQNHELTSL